eukprot:NODE_1813_length_1397_cov_29.899110_g1641_i0.p1 GENE.NODE_1813_length_1397_cov_29.899110_g1641_i0~~NODE_1813_length_1397_cov_29.899110_g1641_i0.p1  ORF type:complete len:121 (-),score=7.17 NODE_1813_length_1397_cov_29.899110_g1641_i0:60-422(-)
MGNCTVCPNRSAFNSTFCVSSLLTRFAFIHSLLNGSPRPRRLLAFFVNPPAQRLQIRSIHRIPSTGEMSPLTPRSARVHTKDLHHAARLQREILILRCPACGHRSGAFVSSKRVLMHECQ